MEKVEQSIQNFIHCKRIAIVGFSRTGHKFGNLAYRELKDRGYEVLAVHPVEKEIAGVRCHPTLSALKGQIDAVLVSVHPSHAVSVLAEAASIGVRNIWLQQGAESAEVFSAARHLNLDIIAKKCLLMYAPPVRSFHGWHRAFNKLLGRL